MKNGIFSFEKIPQSKLINYSYSLVNLSASIEKYCTGESNHTGLSALEPVLKKEYKNIILLLFDGMGMNVLEKFLSPESFIRKNLLCPIHSVFPPTTTAATTTVMTGLTPGEHCWLGWTMFFPQLELNQNVALFPNLIQDTREKAGDFHVAEKFLPVMTLRDKITKTQDWNCDFVSAFGNKKVHSQKEMFEKILKVCESTGIKRNFIYGYQTHPDNLMHITGTYSFAAKFSVLGINRALQKFCKKLYENPETRNTLVLFTADHGHTPVENITLSDFPEFTETLIRPASIEPRACNFFVKNERKKEFEEKFQQLFNKNGDFLLLSKEEVLSSGIFGSTDEEKEYHFDFYLGDFLAIALGNKALVNSCASHHFKSHHGGLTREEMMVPLGIVDVEKLRK